MPSFFFFLVFIILFFVVQCILNPEEFPNLLAGTFTDGNRFSTGNTLPLIGRPWGFNHWSPQTKEAGRFSGSWWFSGNDHTLTWIRCTHQPSPWIGDWGYFMFIPQIGNVQRSPVHEWQSRGAVLKPYLLDITLAPKNIRVELTPTDHAAVVRVTFPPASAQFGSKYVCFSNIHWGDHGMDHANNRAYITGRSTNVNSDRMLVTNFALHMKATSAEAKSVVSQEDMLCFQYPMESTSVVIRIGTSLISMSQVETNLEREVPASRSFEEILLETKTVWNQLMRRVNILDYGELSDASARHLQVFYTGLYRALMFPRRIDEIDSKGQMVHYSPYDPHGGVHAGPLVTDNGLWDTYRTVYPLLSLAYPDHLGTIVQGWLNAYQEGGWLPSWASPGYRNCMVGTFADVVIADAIVKDIPGFDLQLALQALRKDSFEEPPRYVGGAVGKEGLREYMDQGYLSFDRGGEVVSRTLDYGFADYAVSQAMLKVLQDLEQPGTAANAANISPEGLLDDAQKLFQRAVRAYTSLWHAEKQLMVPKSRGSFVGHFSSIEWGNGFTEGNSWHHSFPPYAFECADAKEQYGPYLAKHHVNADSFDCHKGLIGLFPQQEEGAYKRLKALLDSSSDFTFGSYGQEIHEMTEGRALAMGQYFHNNQPVHHMLYLFTILGKQYYRDTQQFVQQVLDRAYGPDFYAGDEDNGEQGAWFVLSALGLYSTTPGNPTYIAGKPLFRHVRITRPQNGKQGTVDQPLDLFAFLPSTAGTGTGAGGAAVASANQFVEQVHFLSSHPEEAAIPLEHHKVDNKYLKDGGMVRFVLESEILAGEVSGQEAYMRSVHATSTDELEAHHHVVSAPASTSGHGKSTGTEGTPSEEVKFLKQELQELTAQLTHLQHKAQSHGPVTTTATTSFSVMRFLPWCCAVLVLLAIVAVYRDLVANDSTGSYGEDKRGWARWWSRFGRIATSANTPTSAKSSVSEYDKELSSEPSQSSSSSRNNYSNTINRRQTYMV